ncbi:hypothetical protein QEG23_000236 [Stenotrophomonas maltophilia]|uniref:Uncharacterized protein n=1 Tax=Stenotrophomonas maltophilia TaxID=40324 RepID=A0AAI9BYE2_STEMA|nr:hypothetical protein [Stenotrophomonas maltophilia]
MSDHKQLIAEMRSAANSLRMNGTSVNVTHNVAAELIDRAADALSLMYTPAQMAESFRAGLETARMQERDANPPPPDWRNAPPDAQFCAMDSDGQWCWYTSCPYTERFAVFEGWDADTGATEIRGLAFYPNWRDTLQERPTGGSDGADDKGSLETEQLLVMAAQAQRNAAGGSSLIAARIDRMVDEVQGTPETKEEPNGR